jgi:hypothetical protein
LGSSEQADVEERGRALLTRALRREGFGELTGEKQPILGEFGVGLVGYLATTVPVVITVWFQLNWWIAVVTAIALIALPIRGNRSDAAMTAVVLSFIVLWLLTAAWQLAEAGIGGVAISHGLILMLLAALAFFRLDFSALVRSLPLLAPLSLLVLLIPLLTAEVWEAASALTPGNVTLLVILLILPVLLILYVRLRGLVFQAYGETSHLLADDPTAELLSQRVRKATSREDAEWMMQVILPVVRARVTAERTPELAATVAIRLAGRLKRTLARRLVPTVAILGVAASAYMYLVASAAIPRSAAERWTGEDIPTRQVDLLWEISVPGGAYLKVAVFLGVAATAIFLALVITDQGYSVSLTDALLHQPAYRSLVLGVPYLVLLDPGQVDASVRTATHADVHRATERPSASP